MVYFRHILAASSFALLQPCLAQNLKALAELAAFGTDFETSQHASTDLDFYQAPANFSSDLKPGMILKVEYATDLANYTVPSSLTMSRIIYTTADVHGAVLPASAYIVWPYHKLPHDDSKGYPVVLWSHGTAGLFQPCAPSNYRSLQYHFMVPYLLATQGMVVVAPDYAGLGVGSLLNGQRIHSAWNTAPAQANDLAYALTASRSAFPRYLAADGPFVALGHSQGGVSAFGFAERSAITPLPGYKGTVTIAPGPDAIAQLEDAFANPSAPWSTYTQGLQMMMIDAVTAVFPAYNWAGFTNSTAAVFHGIFEKFEACLATQSLVGSQLPLDSLALPGWQNNSYVQQWRKLSSVGRKRFAGPLLVISGAADAIIPYSLNYPSSALSVVHDTCDLMEREHWRESLEFVGYQSADHFPIIQASQEKWLGWVKERLASGKNHVKPGCDIKEVEGFRTEFSAKSGPAPNFFVQWFDKLLSWHYAL